MSQTIAEALSYHRLPEKKMREYDYCRCGVNVKIKKFNGRADHACGQDTTHGIHLLNFRWRFGHEFIHLHSPPGGGKGRESALLNASENK